MHAPPSLPFPLRWPFSHPRAFAIGFWALVLGVQATINSLLTTLELRAITPGPQPWEPWLWELSSAAVVAPLVAAVLAWDQRFPLQHPRWRAHLLAHLGGSLLYCSAHVAGMRGLRELAYAALNTPYHPTPWWDMWRYEYLKDVRAYALMLVAVYSYRFWRLRVQGEARVLDAPDPPLDEPGGAPPAPAPPPDSAAASAHSTELPQRFLVRKLRREFLIAANDIAWVQAQANYVALHVHGHEYLLRSTLTEFERQLDPQRFVRVHRSHLVQRDAIAHIEPLDNGDATLHLRDGNQVPCTRRYRAGLVG